MKSDDFRSEEVVTRRDAGRNGKALQAFGGDQPVHAPVCPIETIFPDLEPFKPRNASL